MRSEIYGCCVRVLDMCSIHYLQEEYSRMKKKKKLLKVISLANALVNFIRNIL